MRTSCLPGSIYDQTSRMVAFDSIAWIHRSQSLADFRVKAWLPSEAMMLLYFFCVEICSVGSDGGFKNSLSMGPFLRPMNARC